MTRRVVITGMGTLNPCGSTVAETWENITNGRSGIRPITLFDTTNFPVTVGGEVKNFDPAKYMDAREARRRDRCQQLASATVQEAMQQAGLPITPDNAPRVAVIVSCAIGGGKSFSDAVVTLQEQGPRRLNVFTVPMFMSNGPSGLVGIDIGAKGPNFSVESACASGADGIGTAWNLIRAGVVEAAIAGATDASLVAVGVAAFARLGATTARLEGVPQPFDKERDGVVIGEGAALLVLEALEHAQQRGATILAELAGYASTSDAFHITAPAEDGASGALAMRLAVESAGLNLSDIGYINAHGTGTPLNDAAETVAIKRAFGDLAYRIPVSSTKSMTGHMMGATGALEAILCVQALRAGVLPPTINYHTPDPACDLDYVPNTAREVRLHAAISNSFGFGGHNAVLAFKAYRG
jgi:beta-ketoacyl-acyl-carrier-protein synthase II